MNYILDGKIPILEPDTFKWAEWMQSLPNRIVQQDLIAEKIISTVFLGVDHNWTHQGPPVLFETMIFGMPNQSEEYQERFTTWDDALEGHKKALNLVKESL